MVQAQANVSSASVAPIIAAVVVCSVALIVAVALFAAYRRRRGASRRRPAAAGTTLLKIDSTTQQPRGPIADAAFALDPERGSSQSSGFSAGQVGICPSSEDTLMFARSGSTHLEKCMQ